MEYIKRKFFKIRKSIRDEELDKILRKKLLLKSLEEISQSIDNRIQEILEKKSTNDALYILESIYLLDKIANIIELFYCSENDRYIFVTDSYFLEKCAEDLAYYDKESMLICSGIKLDNIIFLNFAHHPKLYQSFLQVRQEPGEMARIQKELEPYGANIHAIFHSHPGGGIPAPSASDIEYQSIMERLGYKSIAGIFTDDGYIRFFSYRLKFEVLILGRGIAKLEKDIYRLR